MSFICYDTEDNSAELMKAGKSGFDKQVLLLVAIKSDGTKFVSRSVKDFIAWLDRQEETTIWALNAQYDLGNLFSKDITQFDSVLVGGRLIKARRKKHYYLDVYNLWQASVEALGEAFDLPKLPFDPNNIEYAIRDVEIIVKAMNYTYSFCEEMGITNIPATLGGLCIKVWKHEGGQNCYDSTELSKEAYYGGRVELFKLQNDCPRVMWTDINSLYPSVMRGKFPGVLEDCGTDLPKYGVVKCDVVAPKMDVMVLPYRDEIGRVLFPWGKFTGVWTVAELNVAVDRGYKITKIHESMGTDECMMPYGGFVMAMYQRRLASKSPSEKLFYKLLMNNLYGRLGTSGVISRTVWTTEKNQNEGVPFGEKRLVEYSMPLSEETNWAHAAYITSYARLELLYAIEKVGVENMIYCDTDSTIFDCAGDIPFPISKDLGAMKIEQMCSGCLTAWHKEERCTNGGKPADYWPSCMTFLPKMYKVGNFHKAKGVPRRLARDFIDIGKVEFELPFKLREAIRFFDRANSRQLSVWRKVEKAKATTYDKKLLKNNRYFPKQIVAITD